MAAPVWGRYAARGDPKACYVAVEALRGLGCFEPGFLGPVVTTTRRTWTSPGAMHVLPAVIGLASVPLVGLREARMAP